MRALIPLSATSLSVLASALLLAACSDQEAKGDAVDFRPPTNQSRTDFALSLSARFHALDGNHDGALVESELRPAQARRIMAMDADHDGKVTLGEYKDALLKRFDVADTDHDQILSSAERDAAGWGKRRAASTAQ